MPNQILGLNLMGMNNNVDDEWIKGFNMGIAEVNEIEKVDNTNIINIIFKTDRGLTFSLFFKYGTTIDEVLKKFFYKVNRPDLINHKGKITFLFNARQLEFGDKTKIEDFFNFIPNPNVVINNL